MNIFNLTIHLARFKIVYNTQCSRPIWYSGQRSKTARSLHISGRSRASAIRWRFERRHSNVRGERRHHCTGLLCKFRYWFVADAVFFLCVSSCERMCLTGVVSLTQRNPARGTRRTHPISRASRTHRMAIYSAPRNKSCAAARLDINRWCRQMAMRMVRSVAERSVVVAVAVRSHITREPQLAIETLMAALITRTRRANENWTKIHLWSPSMVRRLWTWRVSRC